MLAFKLIVADAQLSTPASSSAAGSAGDRFLIYALIGALTLAVAAFSYWRYSARLRTDEGSTPQCLFQELCAEHDLNRNERNLLLSVVPREYKTQPAVAFVSPDWFEAGARGTGAEAIAYRDLRQKLFGTAV